MAKMGGMAAIGVTYTSLTGEAFIMWFSALGGSLLFVINQKKITEIGLFSIFHIKPTHCQLLVCHINLNKC